VISDFFMPMELLSEEIRPGGQRLSVHKASSARSFISGGSDPHDDTVPK